MTTENDRSHAVREFVHRVNNLLAVIRTQAAVAEASGGGAAAEAALKLIEAAVPPVEAEAKQLRAALDPN